MNPHGKTSSLALHGCDWDRPQGQSSSSAGCLDVGTKGLPASCYTAQLPPAAADRKRRMRTGQRQLQQVILLCNLERSLPGRPALSMLRQRHQLRNVLFAQSATGSSIAKLHTKFSTCN